ncbi:hypothetical protein [Spirochaeta isovalerica]|uniref:Outer membrane protein beta-barrel domain-containing protein n=1 Tax=Spirochaeta isovalerica TaxID=150 RepID=A0A841R9B4_9SPIO|nr:hypothetical protein [Spirochaeta isovalerica]MBB6480495.1 hypothetical protein [Spirochaeta isovalerica]
MKKLIIGLMLTVGIFSLQGQDRPGFYLDSLNIAAPFKVPVSHYRGFSEYEAGFGLQANFKFGGLYGLRVFLGADATYNFNSSERIDLLVDANVNAGIGWEINPGRGAFTMTPQLSAGAVFHILNGDFMLDGNDETTLYIDQLYRFQLEMAYTFKAGEKKKTHVALFISPSFEIFSGETYWGYIPGGTLGIRLIFDPAE